MERTYNGPTLMRLSLICCRAIIASLVSAELADWVGRKKILMGALVISFAAVAIEFVATTNTVFFVGKFLNGFMVGTIATVMISYIGEVSPSSSFSSNLLTVN